jgi:hypothetical protein
LEKSTHALLTINMFRRLCSEYVSFKIAACFRAKLRFPWMSFDPPDMTETDKTLPQHQFWFGF